MSVSDDVQVAKVELLVNGQVVRDRRRVPVRLFRHRPAGRGRCHLVHPPGAGHGHRRQRRPVQPPDRRPGERHLAADVDPLYPRRSVPGGRCVGPGAVRLSEPIDQAIVNLAGVSLTRDGLPVVFGAIRVTSSRGVTLTTTASLGFGSYTLTINPAIIADREAITWPPPPRSTSSSAPRGSSAQPEPRLDRRDARDRPDARLQHRGQLCDPAGFRLRPGRHRGGPPAQHRRRYAYRIAGSVQLNAANTRLTLGLGQALAPDVYRLTVPAARLQDAFGRPLDGEFNGQFPSGDGTPGGDFVLDFTTVRSSGFAFDYLSRAALPQPHLPRVGPRVAPDVVQPDRHGRPQRRRASGCPSHFPRQQKLRGVGPGQCPLRPCRRRLR